MSKPSIDAALLKTNHLFGSLDAGQLKRVIDTTRVFKLKEGERLFLLGQQAEHFFLLVSGQIKLFRVSEDGNEKVIDILGAGRLFAEAVMFMEQSRYPVNAAALSASELYGVRNSIYLDTLRESSELCFALLGDLSRRLHGLLIEIDQLALQNASYRVVGYLMDLLPSPHTASAVIDLGAPKQVIAARLSITPETLSRILRTMAEEGIISTHGKTVGVHDTQRLYEFGRQRLAKHIHQST